MPERIQLRRQRGWRKPEGAVVVSRPSRWGNPYKVGAEGVPDRATAVDLFRMFLQLRAIHPALPSVELAPGTGIPDYPDAAAIRAELGGRDLACWCPLPAEGEPDVCHGAVLLALASTDGAAFVAAVKETP
jgi:hypothetical protein